jgi:hypothetical protein
MLKFIKAFLPKSSDPVMLRKVMFQVVIDGFDLQIVSAALPETDPTTSFCTSIKAPQCGPALAMKPLVRSNEVE